MHHIEFGITGKTNFRSLKVPMQRKLETPQILLSAQVAQSLKSATTQAAQKMLTLEELERNRSKFFILAITK